jgi:hypothetical protein
MSILAGRSLGIPRRRKTSIYDVERKLLPFKSSMSTLKAENLKRSASGWVQCRREDGLGEDMVMAVVPTAIPYQSEVDNYVTCCCWSVRMFNVMETQ